MSLVSLQLTSSFYSSQRFWGDMIAASGAGPAPIPYKKLSVDSLTEAIRICLSDEASAAAAIMSAQMRTESGVRRAATNFHANLPLQTMRCDIQSERPAAWLWKQKGKRLKLSKEAAGVLVAEGRLKWKDLKR